MTKEELRNHIADIINDDAIIPKEQAIDAYTDSLWDAITNHTKDDHNCDQYIESNMCEAHCRICGKKDEQSGVRGIEEKSQSEEWGAWRFVSEMLDTPDESGIYQTSKCYEQIHDFVVEQKQKAVNHLKEQHEAELAREKAYINVYTEFVDEMSVETPFDVAFEELNKKLSEIMDKHE